MLAPDKDRALIEADAALGRFCDLLCTVADPSRVAVGHWTVRDVAVHVAASLDLYSGLLAGAPSPATTIDGVAPMNQRGVDAVVEQDPAVLAERVETAARTYLTAMRARPGDPAVAWHAGVQVPLTTLAALTVGEAMVHGRDVARVTGARWSMPSAWAHTVFRGLLPVVPTYFDSGRAAGMRARFDVRLRGDAATRVVLAVADGRLTVEPSPGGAPVDCTLSADPVAFLLVLYGRTGPAGPAATGRILAWGRRPWLGFVLPGLFRRP